MSSQQDSVENNTFGDLLSELIAPVILSHWPLAQIATLLANHQGNVRLDYRSDSHSSDSHSGSRLISSNASRPLSSFIICVHSVQSSISVSEYHRTFYQASDIA